MHSFLVGAALLSTLADSGAKAPLPIDNKATAETKALFRNLKELSKKGVLFGHQSATEYGRGWSGDEDRSDVKSVVGSHPAVIGLDFMGLSNRSAEEVEKEKERLRKLVEATYNRGGVVTIAWHMPNPVTGGAFYARKDGPETTVEQLLPGGSHHEKFKAILKDVADFAKRCKGKDGKTVPMIFRPWHEFDGDWFWWGAKHCSVEQFKTLFRFTVTELKDTHGVANFLYAFSPDCRFDTEEEFLERYPGDEFVDMVGFDDYAHFGRDGYKLDEGIKRLQVVSDLAKKRGKLAAFTETGLESIPNLTWWTDVLLKTLKSPGLEISYVLVWRNDQNSATHYYAPVPGHPSVPDFKKFFDDPFTFFEKDLKSVYR